MSTVTEGGDTEPEQSGGGEEWRQKGGPGRPLGGNPQISFSSCECGNSQGSALAWDMASQYHHTLGTGYSGCPTKCTLDSNGHCSGINILASYIEAVTAKDCV